MNKSKKISPILNLAFKIIIAVGSAGYISYIVFFQEKNFTKLDTGEQIQLNFTYLKNYLLENISEQPFSLLFLLGTFALVFINFGTEILKWKLLMGKILPVNNRLAIRSVLGGVAASNITPYLIGGYFGRVAQIPFRFRLKGMAIIFIGDTAQFASTVLMGSSALFFLVYRSNSALQLFEHQRISLLLIIGTVLLCAIAFVFMFLRFHYFAPFLSKVKFLTKLTKSWEAVSQLNHRKFIRKLLLISGVRLLAILIQYCLIFEVFGLSIETIDALLITAAVLAIYQFIPAFNILEFGLTKTGLFLILLQTFVAQELVNLNTTVIVTCSLFLIWCMNLAMPSLLGSYYLLKIKLFNHK